MTHVLVVTATEPDEQRLCEYLALDADAVTMVKPDVAVKFAVAMRPDVVIIDAWRGDISTSVIQDLRAEPRVRDIGIIAVISPSASEKRSRALDTGCNCVVSNARIPELLRQLMQRGGAARHQGV